ncbi:enoyl-CoA hydratase/isomerase family protein [Streptomyces sp. NPDC005799]|uniref:enoyl-CoA hydratase/isomerase family protein n=1 Tax=Streptomyces sp. NPDC005799 TaxID=3154678 RepID=UPI0033F538A0
MTISSQPPPAPNTFPAAPVRVEWDQGLARIVLSRGDTGNAFDLDLVTALRDAVEQVVQRTTEPDQGGLRAVLLRAEGRNFSVGGDLKVFLAQGDGTAAYVRSVADTAHAAVLGLAGLHVPVIAEIQGAVAGGGVGLALASDLVVAARSTRLRLAYTALGLTPDCGASWLLPRLVGERRALDLVLTNRVLESAEAEDWGLFNRVVDDAALPAAAEELARALAAGHAYGLYQSKLLVRGAGLDELRDHLAHEAQAIASASSRPQTREAMEQFLTRPRNVPR